jgi:hypothetical protein
MSTDGIYQKYIHAMQLVTGDGTWVDWGVVRLALRLAVLDAYDAGLETCSGMADDLAAIVASQAQSTAERDRLRLQLARAEQELEGRRTSGAAWVEEIARLREQVAAMDADNAELIAEVARLTQQNTIAVDTFNSMVAERHSNGNGVDPTTAAQSQEATAWGRNHPAWDGLDDVSREWLYDLASGVRKFGQTPMELRKDLVLRVMTHLGGNPTMAKFDGHAPAWMAGGSSLTKTFNCKWTELQTQLQVVPA